MKETKGRDDIIRGLNGRILQERRASATKGSLLDESGHLVDRGLGEGIRCNDSILRGTLLHLPGSRRGPEVGPKAAEPVQTPATHLTLMTKSMVTTTARRSRENQSGQGQEVSPGLDVTVRHNIRQSGL